MGERPKAENDAPKFKCFQCAEPVDSQGFDADGYWHGGRAVRVIPPGKGDGGEGSEK